MIFEREDWDYFENERGRGLNPEKDSLGEDFLVGILAVEKFVALGVNSWKQLKERGP